VKYWIGKKLDHRKKPKRWKALGDVNSIEDARELAHIAINLKRQSLTNGLTWTSSDHWYSSEWLGMEHAPSMFSWEVVNTPYVLMDEYYHTYRL
jgi:hypothetical protein